MFQNENSISTVSESVNNPNILCQICGSVAHGKHYNAYSCRACAAFFRRAKLSKLTKRCKKDGKCLFFQKGFFNCKYCRLQQCLKIGMSFSSSNSQLNENYLQSTKALELVPSVSNFLGRPNFIIFSKSENPTNNYKNYIDVQFLIDKAVKVLRQGAITAVHSQNCLKKLGIGLQEVQKSEQIMNPNLMEKIGRDETFYYWENDILNMTQWLTYFDDFRGVPETQQIAIIKVIWKMWNRLATLSTIARETRRSVDKIEKLEKDSVLCGWDTKKLDMSWLSNRTVDELKFFIEDLRTEIRFDSLTQAMLELNPSHEELSYMICQLCFHYVTKQYHGGMSDVTEKLQEKLSEDLHSYYLETKRPHYASRLNQMMKINNQIQKNVFQSRPKIELAIVFDIFHVKCSHPEMFFDL